MNKKKLSTACLLALLCCGGNQALAISESGQDNRVEWQRLASWTLGAKPLAMVHSLDAKYLFVLTENQKVEVYNNQGQLQGSIPVDPGVTAIDIAPQGELLYLIDGSTQTFTAVAISFVVAVDTADAPFKGPADAPVTMVLFTDFECPYCRSVGPVLEEVLAKNPQTVKLVFKNMPLKFHNMADPAARAALAAHEQGKFWEYHDRLFAENALNEALLTKIAEDLGLDLARFNQARESAPIQAKLQKDLVDAQQAGVTGTPTIFINGRLPKQRNLETIQAIIDDELRKLGKS
jgi:protein-disulfide isomerase